MGNRCGRFKEHIDFEESLTFGIVWVVLKIMDPSSL